MAIRAIFPLLPIFPASDLIDEAALDDGAPPRPVPGVFVVSCFKGPKVPASKPSLVLPDAFSILLLFQIWKRNGH
jgi:hypothetical protein